MGLTRIIRNNRATVVCGMLVVAALVGAFVLRAMSGSPGGSRLVALVHDGSGEVHTLPLDTNTQLTVTTSLGTNTLVVEDGAIRMTAADCPNRTCLRTRPLHEPGAQIICLPHKLWVEVVPEGSKGGELDVSLAEQPDEGIDLQTR